MAKYKICNECGKRAIEGTICDVCGEFFCSDKGCDQVHMFEHTTHWEAELEEVE